MKLKDSLRFGSKVFASLVPGFVFTVCVFGLISFFLGPIELFAVSAIVAVVVFTMLPMATFIECYHRVYPGRCSIFFSSLTFFLAYVVYFTIPKDWMIIGWTPVVYWGVQILWFVDFSVWALFHVNLIKDKEARKNDHM